MITFRTQRPLITWFRAKPLAASHGLEVPLIAVHLFMFYFGVMADAPPPVALAAYAAAGLSGADPLETGVQAFIYEMRTAILPVTKGPPEKRLERVGPTARMKDDRLAIIAIDSPAEKIRLDLANQNRIVGIETRIPQPDKAWYTLPAMLLLALVVVTQRRRKAAAAI